MTDWCPYCGSAHIGPCRSIFGGTVPNFIKKDVMRKREERKKEEEEETDDNKED